MAITQSVTTNFKAEVLEGIHNLSVGGDTFYLALYTPSANINSSTTAYTSVGEISGGSYTAGGGALTNLGVTTSGTLAYASWADIAFTGPLTAAGALIYNVSKGNRSVAVLNFGGSYTSDGSTPFTVTFPPNNSVTAIVIFN